MSEPALKFNLPKEADLRETVIARAVMQLRRLPGGKAFVIKVDEMKPRRTENQNSLLWALYADIVRLGGEEMRGYEKDELHEFFLGNHFGWDVRKVFGKTKHTPKRRSSGLNKQEFSDFVESILRFMALRGVALHVQSEAA